MNNWEKCIPGRGRKGKSSEVEVCLVGFNYCKEICVSAVEPGKKKLRSQSMR